MIIIRRIVLFSAISFLIPSCITGKYSATKLDPNSDKPTISDAPMKLKPFGKVQWKYTNFYYSSGTTYFVDGRWKKKGDTLYMRRRMNYDTSEEEVKRYIPAYVIEGKTLNSLNWNLTYEKD